MLPPILQKPIPHSVSALKQDHRKALQQKWLERWKTSPRYAKIVRFDKQLPMKTFTKIRNSLTRAQASLLFQLRTERIPLNKYLHRIKRSDTDKCPACMQNSNQQVAETVKHFLFECPTYRQQRHTMEVKLGRNSRDLKTILQNEKHTKLLIQYVARTGRLKHSLGNLEDPKNANTSLNNTT
jgi:hypothetical protein